MRQATNRMINRKGRSSEKGVVAIELAIVLPLFALLLLGTFEMGLIARDHQALQNAAREGARFSALPKNDISLSGNASTTLQTIQNRVIAYLGNEKITVAASDIDVNQDYPLNLGGLTVTGSKVTITYNRSLVLPGVTSFVPLGTLQLKGTAVFRNFYN